MLQGAKQCSQKKRTHHKGKKYFNWNKIKSTRLCRVLLENNNTNLDRDIEHMINSAYHMTNQTYLVKYLHVAAFIPAKSASYQESTVIQRMNPRTNVS